MREHLGEHGDRRSAAVLALLALVALCALVPPSTAGAGEECSGCTLLGEVSIGSVTVDPPAPVVGDEVTLTFPISYRLPGSPSCPGDCDLVGGEPYLAGDDLPVLAVDTIVVHRRAVQAGVATVELTVTTTTEEQCFYVDPVSGCQFYFQYAHITGSSGEQSVAVSAPTPVPTATPVPGQGDDDGCAIPSRGGSPRTGAAWLIAPVLLLVRKRRASARAA
ncbi:MAG: hypothetical protein U0802_18785 [Candidatus Binatia bacterium]